jgi:hypothetical protein
MLGPSWIKLFERIPVTWHDSLALTLATGTEILLQSVLRLEVDYAIMRGRMSGSTDAGRVLIIPYDQIVNLAFTKRVLEPQAREIFGDLLASPTGPETGAPGQETTAAQTPGAPDAVPVEAAKAPSSSMPTQSSPANPLPGGASAAKNAPPSKSILLARLRARLAEQGK